MNSRERISTIINGGVADRCGFWLGNPDEKTWPLLHKHFGTKTEEELRVKLQDDVRWICPQFFDDVYQDPDGRPMFDFGFDKKTGAHNSVGPLADCETVEDLDKYPWPNPDYLNFDSTIKALEEAGDVYRLSGFWTCFYHNLMDLFGMEEYLIKMYENPEVVLAATDKVCEFYYEANKRFFEKAGNLFEAFFFGNDFGTQKSLICSPKAFDKFIMPWFKKFTQLAHQYDKKVVLHSCGAIHKVIERLIDAEVDCLHPLQALASNMDADSIAADFKGRIAFMGGIDTQDLLINATPDEIKEDVRRVKKILGPNLIVSPSHEALLPDIPAANVAAMAEIAVE
jgi:uroporphyrinogen decarboxylase